MFPLTALAALVGGVVILALAGDILVNGSVSLARRLGMPPLLAGILIVGFGTSLPELVVSLDAALTGYPGMALGNIVGSNIANIWLVLAIPALIATVPLGGPGERRAVAVMLVATALWIGVAAVVPLHAGVGLVFLLLLAAYVAVTIVLSRTAAAGPADASEPGLLSPLRTAIFLIVGLAGLPIGARFIVDGGVDIADYLGVPAELVGLTLLAVGTSLPEVGAGVAAALRGQPGVVVGNILGSNIFNILGIGGLVAFFGPIEISDTFLQYDHWALALSALTLAGLIVLRPRMSRVTAAMLILVYGIYVYGLVHGWNLLGLIGVQLA